MGVDWVTVLAQAVNFLILVWLLKRFLYRPVRDAMNRREQRIAENLREADERRAEAERTRQAYEARRGELDSEREGLLASARDEAEMLREELVVQARAEAEASRGRLHDAVARERREFLAALRRESADAIFAQARAALAELADEGLESRLIERLCDRLARLDERARETLGAAATIRVATAFALEDGQRERLRQAVRAAAGEGPELDFTQDPSLVCGAAVLSDGLRIGWDLDHYLDGVERRLQAYLAGSDVADAG